MFCENFVVPNVQVCLLMICENFIVPNVQVSENSLISSALRKERFSLIRCLESGVPPDSSFPGVTSAMLSKRFIRYIDEHVFDTWDQPTGRITTKIILNIWQDSLLQLRTVGFDAQGKQCELKDAVAFEVEDSLSALSATARQLYRAKQSELNKLGVTATLARIIHKTGHRGINSGKEGRTMDGPSLADLSMDFLCEMMHGGNSEVADALHQYLTEEDSDCKLLGHVEVRLKRDQAFLVEARRRGAFDINSNELDLNAEVEEVCRSAAATARFIKACCEGHHLRFQTTFRTQLLHGNKDVNLIRLVVQILDDACSSPAAVAQIGIQEAHLVGSLLACLTDLTQVLTPHELHIVVS